MPLDLLSDGVTKVNIARAHGLKRQYGFDQKALDLKVGGGTRVAGERGRVVLGGGRYES